MKNKLSQQKLSVQWVGSPAIETKSDENQTTKYYRKCKYNDLELTINDFIRIQTDNNDNYEHIAKIVTMYDYHGRLNQIGVYRFYKAINLTKIKGISFNRKYELVQDISEIYPISFDEIVDKDCYVRYTDVDNDTELNGAKTYKYKEMYFCRYQICDKTTMDLKPILTPTKSSLKTPSRSKINKSVQQEHNNSSKIQKNLTKSQSSSTPKNNVVLVDVKQIQKNVVSPIKIVNNSVKKVTKLNAADISSILIIDDEDENIENDVSPSKRSKFNDETKLISTSNHSARRNLMDSLNDASYGDDLNTTCYSIVKTPKKKDTVLILRKQERRTPKKQNLDYDTAMYGTPKKITDRICERRKSILKTPGSKNVDTPDRKVMFCSLNETPTKKRTNQIEKIIESDDTIDDSSTPKRRATRNNSVTKKTPQQQKENERTPKSKRKSVSSLTPSIGARTTPVCRSDSGIHVARERLHVSAVPTCLPCRDTEFNNIHSFIKSKIKDKCGGCMYVSGVPGTGKTATVTAVIRALQSDKKLTAFEYVEINGMKITEPRQAYVQMYRQISGKTVLWEQAKNLLEKHFTTNTSRRITTVLLVDELDILCNRRQDVVYNILDWPTKTNAQLVVITIANTMDLPERLLMGRVTSRLGLTRLTFQPYTYKQLQEVITARLVGTDSFRSNAVELVARKVASVSGDCRRALDICRRSTEIAENSESTKDEDVQVSMDHVKQALNEMITSVNVQAIKNCSKIEQLFLQAVVAEVTRTGIEEITFLGAYTQMESLSTLMDVTLPGPDRALMLSVRLGTYGLIICGNSRDDLYQKILLNVGVDDVHYAINI